MKRFRLYFWGIFLGMLSVLLYTGNKIFLIGTTVMVFLIIYALLSILWVTIDFNYLQKITPARVKKGERAILEIQIHNDKPFIFPYIEVFYRTPHSIIEKQEKEYICSVLPFQHQSIIEEINCNLRGNFPIGISKVKISDIFGLFTFTIDLTKMPYHKPLILEIWPRILNLTDLPIPLMEQGETLNRNLMVTDEFSNLSDTRPYRPGDTLKRVHWKLSSKLYDVQIKNFETGTQPETLLFIETIPYPIEGLPRYKVEDQIIECSIAVIYHILSRWLPIQLIHYGNNRQHLMGKDANDFERFYNYIGALPFNGLFPIDAVLEMESPQINRGRSMILIVHHLSHSLFNRLYQYRRSGVFSMVLYIHCEQHIEQETKQMLEELNEKGIPSIPVHTGQSLDHVLEAWIS